MVKVGIGVCVRLMLAYRVGVKRVGVGVGFSVGIMVGLRYGLGEKMLVAYIFLHLGQLQAFNGHRFCFCQ